MNPVRKLPFLLLLFLIPPGCTAPAVHHETRFGFGMSLPAEMPAPGPYLEPTDQIAQLDSYVRNESIQLGNCKGTPPQGFDENLADGNLMGALHRIIRACGYFPNRHWTYSNASREMNETRALFNRTPASIVEAEVLTLNWWGFTAASWMVNHNGSWQGGPEISMIHAILISYPWREGTCHYPGFPALVDETRAKFHETLDAANRSTSEDADLFIGSLRNTFIPAFERDVAVGKWWSVLQDREELDWDASGIANLTAPRLPNLAEARYIVAEYRATRHTLSADFSYDFVDSALDTFKTEDAWASAKMYSFQAFPWLYGDVQCSTG